MAQAINTNGADRTFDSMNEAAPSVITEFAAWATLAKQLAQEQVRKEIAGQWPAGHPMYYGGTGADR